jgi:hypothetical protein
MDNAVAHDQWLAHGADLTRRLELCRRHTVGLVQATPTAFLARRLIWWAPVVTLYADGPDLWPSV